MERKMRKETNMHMMNQDLKCLFFIYSEQSIKDLLTLMEELLIVNFDEEMTTTNHPLYFEMKHNMFYDESMCDDCQDGFISYPYILEIECDNSNQTEEYISYLSNLLRAMWHKGLKVVASSDFEAKLPFQGGYGKSPHLWFTEIHAGQTFALECSG